MLGPYKPETLNRTIRVSETSPPQVTALYEVSENNCIESGKGQNSLLKIMELRNFFNLVTWLEVRKKNVML